MEVESGKRRGRPRKVVVDVEPVAEGEGVHRVAHHDGEDGEAGSSGEVEGGEALRSLNWHEWIKVLQAIEEKHFAKRIVKARIPKSGPTFVEGLKASYPLELGSPFVWFNDGTTEIPA